MKENRASEKRHVVLTGAIGVGKSTVMDRALARLSLRGEGIKTGAYEAREAEKKTLYLRAYGSDARGIPFAHTPGADRSYAAACFDAHGVQLLEAARGAAQVIVIDEIGWLERDAHAYHAALRACFDGETPVFAVLRASKNEWADWIRAREDVLLLTVTPENREALVETAAHALASACKRAAESDI